MFSDELLSFLSCLFDFVKSEISTIVLYPDPVREHFDSPGYENYYPYNLGIGFFENLKSIRVKFLSAIFQVDNLEPSTRQNLTPDCIGVLNLRHKLYLVFVTPNNLFKTFRIDNLC